MTAAKAVSLQLRPYKVSHLCFETDGIVEKLAAELGDPVADFDFPSFYAALVTMPCATGDLSRLMYDFAAIDTTVAGYALATLRAESRKITLGNAINSRQNAYFAKYANAPAIIAEINNLYSMAVVGSKPYRLSVLATIANDQFNQLNDAYTADGRLGVVKATGSFISSTTDSKENSTGNTSSQTHDSGSSAQESLAGQIGTPASLDTLPAGGGSMAGDSFSGGGSTARVSKDVVEGTTGDISGTSGSQSSYLLGAATETQNIVNTDYGYRIPSLESNAQLQRAQISLIDQQFAQFMAGQNLPELATVFANELSSIDGNVYRLQVSYLNTILMSPIPGTITGVYKNPGDPVRAGEPVIRVEDNTTVYLVATVVFRGPIALGATITVSAPLYDARPTGALTGTVVSVRGHQDADKWEIVAKCANIDDLGNLRFPIGYRFDFDQVSVSITS